MEKNAPIVADEVRFRSLFENTPELILYQNGEGIILDANPAFLQLVQLPREKVINHCYNDFLQPDVQPMYKQKLKEAMTGKTIRFELFTAQGNSAPRHWDIVKVPLKEDGKVVGVHMLARDITEKMLAQDKVYDQNKDLQQFTYIVSHNLRGPLANAMGLANMLRVEEPRTKIFEDTQANLEKSLNQLDQVLKDMNTILSIRDKRGLVELENMSLAMVVQQVLQNLQETVKDCGATVQVCIPQEVQVQANRAYLYSIFYNLFSNAIKYRAAHRPLEIRVASYPNDSGGVSISFSDNGSGFDVAKAGENVFKLYKRFHKNKGGRGVGLFLVKNHIEAMGGHIEVSSKLNEGTCFLVSLQ